METVIVFYQRPDGVFERHQMCRVDYDEAIRTRTVKMTDEKHPEYGEEKEINGADSLSLEPPPEGAKIVDKVPVNLLTQFPPPSTEQAVRPPPWRKARAGK